LRRDARGKMPTKRKAAAAAAQTAAVANLSAAGQLRAWKKP
jgi:hypothetical protein